VLRNRLAARERATLWEKARRRCYTEKVSLKRLFKVLSATVFESDLTKFCSNGTASHWAWGDLALQNRDAG